MGGTLNLVYVIYRVTADTNLPVKFYNHKARKIKIAVGLGTNGIRLLFLFVYLVMRHLPTLDTLINDDPSALMYKMNPANSIPVGAIVVKSVCQIRHIPTIEAPILYSTDGDIRIAVIRKATALGTPRVVLTAVAFTVFVEVADSYPGVREPRRAHGGLTFNPGIRVRVLGDCS